MGRFRNSTHHYVRAKALEFFTNFIQNHDDIIEDNDTFEILGDLVTQRELVRHIKHEFSPKKLTMLQNWSCRYERLDFEDESKEIFREIWNNESARKTLRNIILGLIETGKKQVPSGRDPFRDRLAELQRTLQLSDFEIDILLVLQFVRNDILSIAHGRKRQGREQENLIFAAKCLNCSLGEVLKAVVPQGKLRRYKCLDGDLDYNGSLDSFLYGFEKEPLANSYFRKDRGEVLPWEFYGELACKHGNILKEMIFAKGDTKPVNILLYGKPGTGKTSFARTLAAELKLNCYCIAQNTNDNREGRSCSTPEFRFGALQVCDSQIEPGQSLIIVDEADEMLRGHGPGGFIAFFGSKDSIETGDKGLLNSVLDSVKTPTIWITNTRAGELDESSRRRFDYSIRFDALTSSQRLMIWRNNVNKMKLGRLFSESMLEAFAGRYAVSAGGITLVLQNIAKLKPSKTEVSALTEKLLAPHCELLNIPSSDGKLLPAKDYSLNGLNIQGDIPPERIINAIRKFRNENSEYPDRPRMNLLLSGPPGTGKTEFVKYLGKTLNTKVIVKIGSDLLSMYVGGTEQNIKQAFMEAEAEKAILFLDEIDGLVQSRERAQRSWEVTQVNELLYQMENFNGVLIGATNFSENLDQATLRRFTFKLAFDYLEETGKKLFFEHVFQTKLSEAEAARLAAIPNLAPGDFRTVRQGLYFLDEDTSNSGRLSRLEYESAAKRQNRFSAKNKVGF